MITWIIFRNDLFGDKLNTKPGDHDIPNAPTIDLLYSIMCEDYRCGYIIAVLYHYIIQHCELCIVLYNTV